MSARELVTGGIVLGAMGIAFATVVYQNDQAVSLDNAAGTAATTAGSTADDLGPGLSPDSTIPAGESSAEIPVPRSGCGSH